MEIMGTSQENKGSSTSKSDSEELIDKFLDAIWMERGLSANTLGAYRADLMTLSRGLSEDDIAIEMRQKRTCSDLSRAGWKVARNLARLPDNFPVSAASFDTSCAKDYVTTIQRRISRCRASGVLCRKR